MTSWKGCGRKRSSPNFKVSRHLPGGTEENHEIPVWISGLRVEILTRDLLNTKQEC
jgi:hypothetical protein